VFVPSKPFQPILILRSLPIVKHLIGAPLCALYYKHNTIINDDSSIINKLETSLIGDVRVVIYDHHMFIVQATGRL
jgi:hypothetical protein